MKSILIDTNILCLVVAGSCLPSALGNHKRLKAFSIRDFQIVIDFLEPFEVISVCPHVLAETSNLLSNTNENHKTVLLSGLKTLMETFDEVGGTSIAAMNRPEYLRLGVTDAVLIALQETGFDLLTADLGLYLAASTQGKIATNFNYLREM